MTIESRAEELGIKPCPFCESPSVSPQAPNIYYILCYSCGAVGPDGETLEKAINLWNKRTTGL